MPYDQVPEIVHPIFFYFNCFTAKEAHQQEANTTEIVKLGITQNNKIRYLQQVVMVVHYLDSQLNKKSLVS